MEKIKLVVMNGIAYVWSVEDWMRIRNLRILGNFIGSLAALPRQDQLAGLPLALLKEETSLLLETGYAVTKQISNILKPPNEDIQTKSSQHRNKLFVEQTEYMRAKRKREIETKIDIILKGKKAKRKCPEGSLNKESVLEEEIKRIQPIKPSSLAVQICTDDPWIEEKDYEDYPWDYPKVKSENLKYSVFKDLWSKGYYITPGGKFGGDYLAYPGDPIKFHAFFIVICLENKIVQMNELVIYGRLGQSVRKTVVLAYLSENNEVSYQSVQWSGF